MNPIHQLTGKTALVTGASRGIGRATALALAQAGAQVLVHYGRGEKEAAAVVEEIRRAGGKAEMLAADLRTPDGPHQLAQRARAIIGGRLDVLVANAGIGAAQARVDEVTAERVQRILAVNVLGPILCCREAVRRLSARHGGPGGSIVLISSAASRLGSPGEYVDYAASKGAVDTLGLGLAREVSGEGIRVNVVRPGIIETEIHASGGQPDRVARIGPTVPIGRAGQASEIAAAVRWLLSDEASYCTGSVLDVAGGR